MLSGIRYPAVRFCFLPQNARERILRKFPDFVRNLLYDKNIPVRKRIFIQFAEA